MSDRNTSYSAYQSWGQVRRKNLIARLVHGAVMTLVGLAALAGLALTVVFAASVAVLGVAGVALMGLMALLRRTPVRVFVKAEKPKADGVFEARKSGSTWIVY